MRGGSGVNARGLPQGRRYRGSPSMTEGPERHKGRPPDQPGPSWEAAMRRSPDRAGTTNTVSLVECADPQEL